MARSPARTSRGGQKGRRRRRARRRGEPRDLRRVRTAEAATAHSSSSGGVDCWGWGSNGQLGNGVFHTTGSEGSDVPVAVKAVGGGGALQASRTSRASGPTDSPAYCAVLANWSGRLLGLRQQGELGDGSLHIAGNDGSAVPVAVKAVGGTGTLAGVGSVVDGTRGFCAVLLSRRRRRLLGRQRAGPARRTGVGGTFAIPESVVGVGGTGSSRASRPSSRGRRGLSARCHRRRRGLLGNGGLGDGLAALQHAQDRARGGWHGDARRGVGLASTTYFNSTRLRLRSTTVVDCWGDGHGERSVTASSTTTRTRRSPSSAWAARHASGDHLGDRQLGRRRLLCDHRGRRRGLLGLRAQRRAWERARVKRDGPSRWSPHLVHGVRVRRATTLSSSVTTLVQRSTPTRHSQCPDKGCGTTSRAAGRWRSA